MIDEQVLLEYLRGQKYSLLDNGSESYEKDKSYEFGSNKMCEKVIKWIYENMTNQNEKVRVDYEAENARLQNILNMKETEYQDKIAEMTDSLIKYERKIGLLQAKLSVVNLIFSK